MALEPEGSRAEASEPFSVEVFVRFLRCASCGAAGEVIVAAAVRLHGSERVALWFCGGGGSRTVSGFGGREMVGLGNLGEAGEFTPRGSQMRTRTPAAARDVT